MVQEDRKEWSSYYLGKHERGQTITFSLEGKLRRTHGLSTGQLPKQGVGCVGSEQATMRVEGVTDTRGS